MFNSSNNNYRSKNKIKIIWNQISSNNSNKSKIYQKNQFFILITKKKIMEMSKGMILKVIIKLNKRNFFEIIKTLNNINKMIPQKNKKSINLKIKKKTLINQQVLQILHINKKKTNKQLKDFKKNEFFFIFKKFK